MLHSIYSSDDKNPPTYFNMKSEKFTEERETDKRQ